jgi:hypothetical protein
MPIYDGGYLERPEDEREQQDDWEDSDDGDLPWQPRHVDDPEPWKNGLWGGTPEEKMHRDLLDDDGA